MNALPVVSRRGLRVAVFAAEAGTILLATAAFVLSFTALQDLAVRSGIDRDLAWLWPLIVDGIIVVATISVFALAGTRVVWYPWLLLILGAGLSVAANAVHALVTADPTVPGVLASSVASVPPLVLVASTHLTAILLRHSRTVLTSPDDPDAVTPPVTSDPPPMVALHESEPLAAVVADALRFDPPAAPDPAGVGTAVDAELLASVGATSGALDPDSRRALAMQLREVGLNNAQIARLFGVDRSTVGRWLAKPSQEEQETPS